LLLHGVSGGKYATHSPANPKCELHDLGRVESEVLGSLLGSRFEVYVSAHPSASGDPPVARGFCEATNAKVVAGADFNGRLWAGGKS